ncbi:MAG: Xanthine oxidase, partial [Candidatus Solibacter sp.]|nr:Xanthine oxidase [Candidatus Solibacter sp.]
MSYVAKPLPHESARQHVTGGALYTDDLASRFPNLLHAVPVLAPHAHAKFVSIEYSAAAAEPGVVTVLTASDVPGEGDSGANRHDEPLFPDTVMFHRQPVAWVLGETLEAARAGAAKVRAAYQPLKPIVHLRDAIAAKSYLCGPLQLQRGDARAGIAASPHQLEGEVFMGGQEHFYLETQAALAWLDESGGVALHASTQHPSETQEIVARVLGIAAHRVTVECLRMGGAFGGKEVQSNPYAAIAAVGAWKTKRPVLVRLPRVLDMAITGKRHPFLARFAAGYDDDGRILGLDVNLFGDGGWSLDLSEPILGRALFHIDNAYMLPAVHVSGYVCRTNKTSQTAFRGFGGPQGMLVIEEVLDRVARSLG